MSETDRDADVDTREGIDAEHRGTSLDAPGAPVPAEDADATTEPSDDDTRAIGSRLAALWGRWRWLLPWILAALAVAMAVVSTIQWQQLAAVERDREAVERAAGRFMLTLTTWDATEGMGATREALRERGTEQFAGEVEELFGTTEDLAGLADVGARSDGDVRRLHVQEVEGDRAVALVVVTQRLVTDVTEGEEVSTRYAEVDLVRRDDRWLVDEVELLVDVGEQEAEPATPETQDPEEPS